MKKDNRYQAPQASLDRSLVEDELIKRADNPSPAGEIAAESANTDTIPADNLPEKQQDHPSVQEIDNIHTYVQGKSASILENAMSKLISDLKNKRFENKKTPRK